MAKKAYFMVDVSEEFCHDDSQRILKDLEAIPEVESVERVSGTCDLVVKVEVPVSSWTIFAANKLLAKEWVKRLQVINVEPLRANNHPSQREEALIDTAHL